MKSPRARLILGLLSLLVGAAAHGQTNDSFANRLMLTGSPTTALSNNLRATHEAGEPDHANDGGARSLWWTWTAPASGWVNFGAYGGGAVPAGVLFHTPPPRTLAVYTGDKIEALGELASASTPADAVYYLSAARPAGPSFNVQVTAGTTYQIVVDAPGALTPGDDGTTVLTINGTPSVYSSAGAAGMVGNAFTYTILASNNPTGYGATGLPTGLALDPYTGSITGIPQAAGVYVVGLSATNPGGTARATLNLTVNATPTAATVPAMPVIGSSAMAGGTVGTQFSYSLSASGSPSSYGAANLPPGLGIDTTSGSLSGTPTAAGDFTVPMTATNATGTGNATVVIHVAAGPHPPVITSSLAASGTVGASFYYSVSTLGSSGVDQPTGYSASNLPPGLGFDPIKGYLRGSPTAAGVFAVPISAVNAAGTGNAVVTITIAAPAPAAGPQPAPPLLSSPATASAIVGTLFTYQLTASNAPTVFAAGSLPPGLSLNAQNGYLTGTPLAAGAYQLPVSVSNGYSTSTATLTLNVAASAPSTATGTPPVIGSTAEVSTYVGGFVNYTFTGANGSPLYPYYGATYSVSNLPPGLNFSSANPYFPTVSGVPTTAGTYPTRIAVSVPSTNDSYPHQTITGTAVVTFVVGSAAPSAAPAVPVFTSAASVAGAVGSPFGGYTASANGSPTSFAASGLPPGLTFDTASRAVTGTPTQAGTYPAVFTATGSAGTGSATVTFSIAANPAPVAPPVVSSAATASGAVGSSFSYTISASNSPMGYGASNPPPGLTVDPAAGTISGTPTAAGVFTVPISATNAGGTGNATLTLTVAAGPAGPVISSDATARGTVGSPFTYYLSASPSPTSYAAGTLPPGLTLNTASGIISGTPTAGGTYSVAVSATNAGGSGNGTLTFTIAATPAPPILSGNAAADATVGSAFAYTISASNSPTGYATSGLPDGLGINTASGLISGTPTTAGTYSVAVSATNSGGTGNATLTITVATSAPAAPPVISSPLAATGLVGTAFKYTITASASPTSYELGASLPSGLSFVAATGVISGTPTKAGTYAIPVTATNAAGTGRATATLVIGTPSTARPVFTCAAGFNGYVGLPLYLPLSANNLPTSFSASNLPAGLSLNPATGLLSGRPTAGGVFTIPVTAANTAGTGTASLTLRITPSSYGHITSPLAAGAVRGTAFSYAITATGTVSSYSVNSVPPGLSFNASTGVLSGTPTTAGTFPLSMTAFSSTAGTLTAPLSITVTAASTGIPVLTSSAGALAYYGEPFYYPLTATNNPTNFSVSGLPSGLSYDPAQKVISGLPTVDSGTYSVSLAAINATGTGSGVMTLSLKSGIAPRVATAAVASGLAGAAFSYQIGTNAGANAYNYAASNLPAGLSLNPATGLISGTPTAAGSFVVPLTVATFIGTTNASLTIIVDAAPTSPPVFTSAAELVGTVGSPLSYGTTASNLPTAFTATGLPAGLAIDAATGTISGVPTAAGTFRPALTAINAAGTGTATLTVILAAGPTAPPVLNANSLAVTATLGNAGRVYQFQASNGPVTFAASGLPPGLSVDLANGVVSGTPTAAGVFATTVSATNSAGTSSATVTFTVNAGNAPVLFSVAANQTGSVGVSFDRYVSAINSPTSYAASGLPPGLFLSAATGEIFGAPTVAGTYSTTVSATNSLGSDQATVVFLVAGAGAAPVFSGDSAGAAGNVGGSFYRSFYASNGPTSYSVSGLPPGLSYSFSAGSSVSIQGTPTGAGVFPVRISASNAGGTASEIVTLAIAPASAAPPFITGAAGARGSVGAAFGYRVVASNAPVSYGASGLPDGLRIDANSGLISGMPTAAGSYPVTITATNANGTATAVVTLQIDSAAPAVSLPAITSAAAASFSGSSTDAFAYLTGQASRTFGYTITASNAPASFGAVNLPAGLTLNPYTGVLSGTPQVAGVFEVPITATNAAGTASATLTIIAPATVPAIRSALTMDGAVGSGFYRRIDTGTSYNEFLFLGIDLPPDAPTFTAAGLPPGLSLDRSTGVIAGTPTLAGEFPVTVAASNRAGTGTAVVTFAIAANAPAVLANVPSFYGNATALGFVNAPLSFYLSGTGTSYGASGLPDGLSLDATVGRITGTPTAAGVYTVPVSTTNSTGTANATLTVTILAAPDAPIIGSGAGASATVSTGFGYSIYANSGNFTSKPMSYGATGLPPGLNFNATNGYLSGTPTQAGNYVVGISATSAGVTSRATLALTVQPAPASPAIPAAPVFGGPAGALAFLGNPFVYPVTLDGFSPDGALPDGLAFDPVARTISGVPTGAGDFTVGLSATNDGGTGHASLDLNIVAPQLSLPRITAQPAGVAVAQGAGATLTATATGAPSPAFQWTHDGVIVPGATGPTLILGAAQPADAGTYVLTVSNSSGSATSAPAVLRALQTYGNWQSVYFSPAEIAAGLAAGGYDFDGDGLPNLLAYALGRNPRTGQGGAAPVTSRTAAGALQIQFPRDIGKTDLTYIVEVSPDLQQWTAIARSIDGAATSNLGGAGVVTESTNGGGIVTVTVQDAVFPAPGSARFLRLQVSQ